MSETGGYEEESNNRRKQDQDRCGERGAKRFQALTNFIERQSCGLSLHGLRRQ